MTHSHKSRSPGILVGRPQLKVSPSVGGSQVSVRVSGTKGSRGEAKNLTVLGLYFGLACAYYVTSDKSLCLSEPVSSLGTYLKVAMWGVQQMLYVKRKMQEAPGI